MTHNHDHQHDCHDHDHHHDHDHPHDHHYCHHNEIQSSLSFEDKMIKLFEHWIKHNTDHAQTYTDWAEKAKENDLANVSDLLKSVADMTISINKKFEDAIGMIKKR